MAKMVVHQNGFKTWALTEAEDYVVLDAYEKVKRFVPATDTRWSEMEFNFIGGGKMLSDLDLISLNNYLKRKNYPPIVLRESHSDSHSILNGMDKAECRRDILQNLRGMTPAQRDLVIKQRRDTILRQPGRDVVYDAVKANRNHPLAITSQDIKRAETKLSDQLADAVTKGDLKPQPRILPAIKPPEPAPEPSHHNVGTMWMHRSGVRKRVRSQAEADEHLKDGWMMGRGRNDPRPDSPSTPPMPIKEMSPVTPTPEPAQAGDDDIDIEAIEAALSERQSKASEASNEAYESLKEEVVALRDELTRLKRVVYKFASAI